ncbi:hypothetical protein, partial [Frankia sp. CiP3]|uniref:hypothetical protein n=1 Tax=Frankia sp. CiP3 TaxID=2880971 RepID=UPI001EF63D64
VLGPVDRLHLALRATGFMVQRDEPLSGQTVDLVVCGAAGKVAVVVDDPAGDPDGRVLRKVLARVDIVGGHVPVHRVPAWRCLTEPEEVAAELSEYLHRLGCAEK